MALFVLTVRLICVLSQWTDEEYCGNAQIKLGPRLRIFVIRMPWPSYF